MSSDSKIKFKNKVAELAKNHQRAPSLGWRDEDGEFTPIVTFSDIVMPLDPRPFKGFYKGERDAILVWIKQVFSESLFDVPYLLVNDKSHISAKNPDWDLQPYYEADEVEIGVYNEVRPTPSMEQLDAGERLPV
jgi:hypothetical protein|tara:strand:+ start:259 stop:660 length:402 start_codon:yes stop_codon:yes gene_type:complete